MGSSKPVANWERAPQRSSAAWEPQIHGHHSSRLWLPVATKTSWSTGENDIRGKAKNDNKIHRPVLLHHKCYSSRRSDRVCVTRFCWAYRVCYAQHFRPQLSISARSWYRQEWGKSSAATSLCTFSLIDLSFSFMNTSSTWLIAEQAKVGHWRGKRRDSNN